MKPVKHTNSNTNNLSKGERLNWMPLSEVRPVPLTQDATKGKEVSVDQGRSSQSSKFLVP